MKIRDLIGVIEFDRIIRIYFPLNSYISTDIKLEKNENEGTGLTQKYLQRCEQIKERKKLEIFKERWRAL